MVTKIKYNKDKSGRILIGGGPRDIQLRQRLIQAELIKHSVGDKLKKQEIDLSQYLLLSEVKKKIEEAVEFTKKNEKEIYKTIKQKLIEKDLTIAKLTSELSVKDEIYMNLQINMAKIYKRISDGSTQSFVGKNRPELGDKIFIDPIEKKKEPELDLHINIKEEESTDGSSDNSIDGDLVKLRNLLKL